jgi:hypothetical protein
MSKSFRVKCLVAALAVVGAWGGYRAFRAQTKSVTLNVRDADVRKVVRSIEWQTWEKILVNRDVQGTVTLQVQDAPLAEALQMVAQQVRCRCSRLQPLYSSSQSLSDFKKGILGEVDPATVGWSNVASLVHSPLPTKPRNRGANGEEPITLLMTNRPLRLAGLVFSHFANLELLPEDGTPQTLTLTLRLAPVQDALHAIAGALGRQTKSYYSLLPASGPFMGENGPPGPGSGRSDGPPDGPGVPFMPGPPNRPPDGSPNGPPDGPPGDGPGLSKELREQMGQDYSDLMSVLPPDQRFRLQSERQSPPRMDNTPGPDGAPPPQPISGPELERQRQWLQHSTVAERVGQDRLDAEKNH